jgi:diguanylate cyclase (GGDEF)-like protein
MRIVLADPSRIGLKLMAKMLTDGGHEVLPFNDGAAALERLRDDDTIEVLLTSFEVPGVSGLELCWEARLIANSRHPIYVVAMSSSHDRERLIEALDSGADDFICKPPIATELFARLRAGERMTSAQRELVRLANIDSLTGLPNRRAFFEIAGDACLRNDGSTPLSLVMFDIDHFKQVNDTWGHDVGDIVLKAVAEVIRRHGGHPGRIGGEEFAVLFEGWDLLDAYHEAERLRVDLQATTMEGAGVALSVTASLGVAEHVAGQSIDLLLKNADIALYAAKTGGRNRVIAAQRSAARDSRPEEPIAVQTIYLAC